MRNIKGNLIKTAVIVPTVAIAIASSFTPAYAMTERPDKHLPRLEKMMQRRKLVSHERNISNVVKKLEQLEYKISTKLKEKDKEGTGNKYTHIKEDLNTLRTGLEVLKGLNTKYLSDLENNKAEIQNDQEQMGQVLKALRDLAKDKLNRDINELKR